MNNLYPHLERPSDSSTDSEEGFTISFGGSEVQRMLDSSVSHQEKNKDVEEEELQFLFDEDELNPLSQQRKKEDSPVSVVNPPPSPLTLLETPRSNNTFFNKKFSEQYPLQMNNPKSMISKLPLRKDVEYLASTAKFSEEVPGKVKKVDDEEFSFSLAFK